MDHAQKITYFDFYGEWAKLVMKESDGEVNWEQQERYSLELLEVDYENDRFISVFEGTYILSYSSSYDEDGYSQDVYGVKPTQQQPISR